MRKEKPQDVDSPRDSWTLVKGTLTSVTALILAAAGLVGVYHVFYSAIDTRVEEIPSDPELLHKLANRVRPAVIFDEDESILADMGGMDFIENITVDKEGDVWMVRVSPRELVEVAPTLESLDESFAVRCKKGPKYDWIFELYPTGNAVVIGGLVNPPTSSPRRFRLELVR